MRDHLRCEQFQQFLEAMEVRTQIHQEMVHSPDVEVSHPFHDLRDVARHQDPAQVVEAAVAAGGLIQYLLPSDEVLSAEISSPAYASALVRAIRSRGITPTTQGGRPISASSDRR